MPHIHTQPDQHDMTVGAWIVRKFKNDWKCLVHYHKKMDVLMQIGGHIELDETPWQAMIHELREESGYDISELKILQFLPDKITGTKNVIHPTPFSINTHLVGNQHFHSDISYGFIAGHRPQNKPAGNESSDLRWLSLAELEAGVKSSKVLKDVLATYKFLLKNKDKFVRKNPAEFSAGKPQVASATYKRGKPGE